MKKVIILFLLLPVFVQAQTYELHSAINRIGTRDSFYLKVGTDSLYEKEGNTYTFSKLRRIITFNNFITSSALSPYITSATAAASFQPAGSYLTASSLTGYLTTANAASTYQPLGSYLTGATAAATYQPIGSYAAASHLHTGVYQPVGSYLVAADLSPYLTSATAAGTYQVAGSYASSSHTHAYNTLTGLPTLFDGNYNSLTNKPTLFTQATADGLYSALAHTHTYPYTIGITALSSSPVDAQTIFLSNVPRIPATVSGTQKIFFRATGTITAAEIYTTSSTAGTAEAWSFYVRKNNTTDYLIQTISLATSERIFTNSSLSIPVVSGDYIEIKAVNPTWVTNPLAFIVGGYIKIN